MKLIKLEDIRWDIVKANFPSWKLIGWPIIGPFVSNSPRLFSFKKYEIPPKYGLEFRIPFAPLVVWTWDGEYDGDKMYPVVSHKTVNFLWGGFFWFWRET